jgi:Domain of unknown function (DUF6089)
LINAIDFHNLRYLSGMKICSTILVLFIFSGLHVSLVAQTSRKNKSHELGFNFGGGYYIGEINPHYEGIFQQSKLSFGMSYKRFFTKRWGVRASAMYGNTEAWDKNSSDPLQQYRNLNFRNRFYEFGLMGEINFFDYQMNSKEWITPYMFGGMAYYMMNPEGFYQGGWIPLQTMYTEAQTTANQYKLNGISLPFGVGLKLNVLGALGFSFEWSMRKTWTDYFDDVSGIYPDKQLQMAQYGPLSAGLSDPSSQGQISLGNGVSTNSNIQRGDPSNNDHYGFFLVSLMIRMDKPATNCFK